MKKLLFFITVFTASLYACNNAGKVESENDVDAARNFIKAALNGDYDKAATYMIKDSANEEWMRQVKRVPISPENKKGLAEASIIIRKRIELNDTATIVIYANSFKNNDDTLRVIKKGEQWLVDFDYLFTHDRDSLWKTAPVIINDSVLK